MSVSNVALFGVATLFGLMSGFNDGGNLLGSYTAGRVISPRLALLLLGPALLGPLLVGTGVARTVGISVVDLGSQGSVGFVLITLVSLSVVMISWSLRVPTSMTLALVGAMLGWVLIDGLEMVRWAGVARVLIGMPVSVLGGGALAWLLYRFLRLFAGNFSYASMLSAARMQYLTAAFQSLAYGANDMEKTMGLLVVAQAFERPGQPLIFSAPLPLMLAFASFFLGTLLGGWRLARRVGSGVYKVSSTQGATLQLSASVMVAGLALAGAPVSTTQTIDGARIGVGTSVRASAVRWGLVREMLSSWLLTLPIALLAAFAIHLVLRALGLTP